LYEAGSVERSLRSSELDFGDILRRETGSKTPKIIRLVTGNPLIMKEMVKHVPDEQTSSEGLREFCRRKRMRYAPSP
jgi:hypothetical protein